MKHLIITIISLIICAELLFGQIKFDTISVTQVGKGIKHLNIKELKTPWNLSVLEIDLNSGENLIKTVKAQDLLEGYEKTSSMAARNSSPGHRVVGAINGDFYGGGGVPINTQIIDGEILRMPIPLSTIGFSENMSPSLSVVGYSGIALRNADFCQLGGVNKSRDANQLIIYNEFFGASTGTNAFGSEAVLQNINSWTVNDTVLCVVEQIFNGAGNSAIPSGRVVLSGHGTAKDFIDSKLSVGDTLKLVNSLTPAPNKLWQLIGGFPQIVKNGINWTDEGFNDEGGPSHAYQREPRTAMGFSSDSTKVYFVTVDGRNADLSAGMTLNELADFMISIGIAHGINLDGGGSTTMVVNNAIVNYPSDGAGERSVANSVIAVNTSSSSGNLNSIQISPDNYKVFWGESAQFTASGWDENFHPATINSSEVTYTLSKNLGEISADGFFVANFNSDTGYAIADYQGLRDSALVIVKGIEKISLSPAEAVTDTIKTIEFKATAFDMDGILRPWDLTNYSWTVSDQSVGQITNEGVFKGLTEGQTEVILELNDLTDTALVTVVVKEGSDVLHSMENFSDFQLAGENIVLDSTYLFENSSTFSEGSASMGIKYQYVGDPQKINYVYLDTNIPIEGAPDSIYIDAYGDGYNHHVQFIFSDGNGELWQTNTLKWASSVDNFDFLPASIKDASPLEIGSFMNYPITIEKIIIKLGSPRSSGVTYNSNFYLDNLRAIYLGSLTSVEEYEELTKDFALKQNYPNPFNPTTKIVFQTPERSVVELKVFDILGREVEELFNAEINAGSHEITFMGENLASGVYFYRLKTANGIMIKKMVLQK